MTVKELQELLKAYSPNIKLWSPRTPREMDLASLLQSPQTNLT